MASRRYDINNTKIELIYYTDYWDQPLSGFATLDGKLTMFRWPFDRNKIIVADPPNTIKRILIRLNLEWTRIRFGSNWDTSSYYDLPLSFKISRLGMYGIIKKLKGEK